MEIQGQILVYFLIIIIYFLVKRRKNLTTKNIFANIGFSISFPKFYIIGIGISLLTVVVVILLYLLFPIEISLLKNTTFTHYQNYEITLLTISIIFFRELLFIAFWEELFFRGLIGGILFRTYSFKIANSLQTLIFLIPHLLLLIISIELLPFLLVIIVSGWLLGWLRYKSNSILPGSIAHALTNTIAVILMLYNQ